MPFVIDQEKMNDPSTVTMDIGKPPLKYMQHEEYPKMLYLHPKDKSKEHLTKIVHDADERDAAMNEGWRQTPHIQQFQTSTIPSGFEADIAEPVAEKRGPGRPPKTDHATA